MIVSSIRKLAEELGVSHTILNRYRQRGKFKEEPGGGFNVEKVRAALGRTADISQPVPETDGVTGSNSYELFIRARAVKEMAIAKERQSGIPFEERVPAVWQQIMGCRTKGDKNVSKARAQQLFPQLNVTHAVADALLIASAARILWLNSHSAVSERKQRR